MDNILLISNLKYYKIDCLFYKKFNVSFTSIGDAISYSNILSNIDNSRQVIFILDPMMFDNMCKTSSLFNHQLHGRVDFFDKNTDKFFNNYKIFSEKFPENTKFILYDNDVESKNESTRKMIPSWLDISSNNYVITSRNVELKHSRLIQNLIYLPIIYSFYINDFDKFPMLNIPNVKDTKYDFITYLGHTKKISTIEYRLNFLKKVFNNDLTNIKYKDLDIVSDENFGTAKEGHIWNLLNSLSAKIQLIFENSKPESPWDSDDFFTEKTMKCLVSSHPYILLLHPKPLTMLEKYGFKFPIKCNDILEFKKNLNYVKNNIDSWVEENRQTFYNNQINFYKMIESTELPHHQFLYKIIQK